MTKVIAEKVQEQAQDSVKMVEIKNTRTMQDASGNDVEVVDWIETKSVDEAISQAEARKASLDAQVVEVAQEITDLEAIRDAE